MEILLDGKQVINKQILFLTLKEQINSNEFYGDNLDALWDVLSSTEEEIFVTILHQEDLNNNLGEYAELLIELFHDLKDVNDKVCLKF
ncbi:MAG TPA: barstar family protein [Acholeplasmataceae bacterium]|nr:barstar family protein [Acholeplasmataceae bacterium]